MQFCQVFNKGKIESGIVVGERVITFSELGQIGPIREDLLRVIGDQEAMSNLKRSLSQLPQGREDVGIPLGEVQFSPPLNAPPKIFCVGLTYRKRAAELGFPVTSEPSSFIKPRTAIIGHGQTIVLPPQSQKVTAEAELGIVIGRRCKNLTDEEADSVVFGYVPTLDIGAEDILQRDYRYITRAKAFDTFFSFGPVIKTSDEIQDLSDLTISTVLNGKTIGSDKVRNMIFSPRELISHHSQVMTFEPGDIICSGSPSGVVLKDGDVVECRLDGFPPLANPVRRSK